MLMIHQTKLRCKVCNYFPEFFQCYIKFKILLLN